MTSTYQRLIIQIERQSRSISPNFKLNLGKSAVILIS